VERWYERVQQVVERLEYIEVVQQGRDKEKYGIQMKGKISLNRMNRSAEYWAKMSRDPHQEIQEQWTRCKKHWDKINKIMKFFELPEFGTPDNFIDLSDMVKLHVEQDVLWTKEFSKIVDAKLGQVRQFPEHLIRARTMLQLLDKSVSADTNRSP
jgi:hypothetical protein